MKQKLPKVLLVDDRPENLLALENELEALELEFLKALSGNEALKIAAREDLALILLDVQMPEMDGFETAEILRFDEQTRHIPIIFVTAINREEQYIFKGYELGAVDYLFKPIEPNMLKSKVSVFLELYLQKQQIMEQAKKLEEALKLMTQEMEQAQMTQLSILPQKLPKVPGLQMVTKYVPMTQIGGDFYDVLKFREEKIGIFIADVSGHGVPAALFSFMISGLFRSLAPDLSSPAVLVQTLNDTLHYKIPNNKFITAFYCIYDPDTQSLTYASAGHPPAYIIRSSPSSTKPEIMSLPKTGMLLGPFPGEIAKFEEQTYQLLPGDKLFLYTDGIAEIRNVSREIFGYNRLTEYLSEHCHVPLKELLENVCDHVLEYSEQSEFEDDITLVGLEVTEKD